MLGQCLTNQSSVFCPRHNKILIKSRDSDVDDACNQDQLIDNDREEWRNWTIKAGSHDPIFGSDSFFGIVSSHKNVDSGR